MIVQASDNRGIYTRYTNVSVTVNVVRNQSPFFINQPYGFQISERTDVATSLYRVTANDNDLIGNIVYTVIGDIPAPSYFSVDSTSGAISARADLTLDTTLQYTVSGMWCDTSTGSTQKQLKYMNTTVVLNVM